MVSVDVEHHVYIQKVAHPPSGELVFTAIDKSYFAGTRTSRTSFGRSITYLRHVYNCIHTHTHTHTHTHAHTHTHDANAALVDVVNTGIECAYTVCRRASKAAMRTVWPRSSMSCCYTCPLVKHQITPSNPPDNKIHTPKQTRGPDSSSREMGGEGEGRAGEGRRWGWGVGGSGVFRSTISPFWFK